MGQTMDVLRERSDRVINFRLESEVYESTQTHHRLAVGFLPPPLLGLKAFHSNDVTRRVVMASLGLKLLLLQLS